MFNSIIAGVLALCSAAAWSKEGATATKVACVGDSITYGMGIKNREVNSYPAQLATLLGDQWTVRNFGRTPPRC